MGHSELPAFEQPDLDDEAMIISFGWTSDALLAGFKDTTRRDWDREYVRLCQSSGRLIDRYILDAWDALPRVKSKNPKMIARVQLKAEPLLSRELPPTDYAREGFEWLSRHGYTLNGIPPLETWRGWEYIWRGENIAQPANPLWVIRFNVVELTQAGRDRRDQLLQEGKEIRPLPMVS